MCFLPTFQHLHRHGGGLIRGVLVDAVGLGSHHLSEAALPQRFAQRQTTGEKVSENKSVSMKTIHSRDLGLWFPKIQVVEGKDWVVDLFLFTSTHTATRTNPLRNRQSKLETLSSRGAAILIIRQLKPSLKTTSHYFNSKTPSLWAADLLIPGELPVWVVGQFELQDASQHGGAAGRETSHPHQRRTGLPR